MSSDADGVPREVLLPTGESIWVRVQPAMPGPDFDDIDEDDEDDEYEEDDQDDEAAQDVGGLRRRRRRDAAGEDGTPQISQLIGFTETVGGIAHSVRKSLAKSRPDHVEVEFGLEIDASTGQVISLVASAHAKASIKVKMGWTHTLSPDSGDEGGGEVGEPEHHATPQGVEPAAESGAGAPDATRLHVVEAVLAVEEDVVSVLSETRPDPGSDGVVLES